MYGRGPMGTRLRAARAFRRHRGGYSGLAYMTIDGIEDASFSDPGLRYEKCDREWFLMSVYTKLLPLVRRTPGAIVICDNARIHHSQVFIDLVEKNYDGTPTPAHRSEGAISAAVLARIKSDW